MDFVANIFLALYMTLPYVVLHRGTKVLQIRRKGIFLAVVVGALWLYGGRGVLVSGVFGVLGLVLFITVCSLSGHLREVLAASIVMNLLAGACVVVSAVGLYFYGPIEPVVITQGLVYTLVISAATVFTYALIIISPVLTPNLAMEWMELLTIKPKREE